MNRRSKLTAVIAPLTLAVLALGGYTYTRAHAAPTYRLANGIEVTPTINSQDETAQLLEIKSWDFDITQPDASKPLYTSFVLYNKGKFVKTMNGGTGRFPNPSGPPEKGPVTTHISLALLPLGSFISDARELKYKMTKGASSISGSMTNPIFKGKNISSEMQVVPANNVILLLSTDRANPYIYSSMSDNDTILALSIAETPPR